MTDPLESKFGPLVSEEPCASLDLTYVLNGTYVTLELIREEHFASLWTNLDLTGAGSSNEDFLPGPRTETFEKLKEDLITLEEAGIPAYAIKADPKCLGPGGSGRRVPSEEEKNEVLGVLFYDPKPSMREVEIGMIIAKVLQRTYASTEAHYLWLRNVCEQDSPGLVGGRSLPYRKVHWKCNSLNLGSKRCAERIGYVMEGRLRKNMIAKGRSRDTDLYGFVDDEWPAIKAALELWLGEESFDADGRQKRRLEDIRKSL